MHLSLDRNSLVQYVSKQVNTFFPDHQPLPAEIVDKNIDVTIQRMEYCFSKVRNKYFFDGKNTVFNHLNGDQYAMFLYFLGNTMYRAHTDPAFCAKLFLLNKYLHSLDAFYEVELPDIFLLVHPLGTVLGRAKYSNYFITYQRCGVGSNHNIYPEFGEYLTMHPGSSILGNSKIGKNCKIAAESLVLDENLPDNTLYIGDPKKKYKKISTEISQFWRDI